MRMRVCAALLLLISVTAVARSQQSPCATTAHVVTLDPSSFPDKAAARWALSQMERWSEGRPFPYGADSNATVLGWPLPGLGASVPLWEPAHKLPPGAFTAHDEHRPIPVLSAEVNRGPRRILLLADNGKKIRVAARDIEIEAIKTVLCNARPEDSIALLTAGGPRVAVPFGSSRQAIELALKGLRQPAQRRPQGDRVSGELLEAAKSFGTPQEGDAIILFARTLTGSRRAEVRSALTSRGIRLFCLGLGAMLESGTLASFEAGYSINALVTLSEETGGGWEQAGPLPHRGPATDANLQVARKEARDLYEMATTLYILRLERTGPHVFIEPSPEVIDQIPWARVLYPRPLPKCP
jgi:hypothetical protein